MTDRSLPSDPQAEGVLIARLLLDQRQIPVIAGQLSEEDFYTPRFARAFGGMKKLSQEQKPIDVLTLRPFLGGESIDGVMDDIGIGHASDVSVYADVLAGLSFRRRVITGLERVIARAMRGDDRNALIADLHDVSSRVMQDTDDDRLLSPDRAVDQYEKTLDKRHASGQTGLTWGFTSLDKWWNPAHGGEMIVIAARPSVGKTALAEYLADVWAKQSDFPVLFCSLEMGVSDIMDRIVSRYGDISASSIVRGRLTDIEREAAREIAEDRRRSRIWYLDDPRATTDSVRAAAAKVKMLQGGLAAIVIDYLQLLKDPGDTEVHRVTRISRQIKALAREYDVPVLALSQLSRAVESRDDRHPKLHDLRESGAIEQDADRVIGLHRELGTRDLDIEVLKNRQGNVGRDSLWFDGDKMRFTEVVGESVSAGYGPGVE
jgi:replicative DNA helicase